MSIYGIGFLLAAVLYFYYALKTKKTLTSTDIILGIVAGLGSWVGVIVMVAIINFD